MATVLIVIKSALLGAGVTTTALGVRDRTNALVILGGLLLGAFAAWPS